MYYSTLFEFEEKHRGENIYKTDEVNNNKLYIIVRGSISVVSTTYKMQKFTNIDYFKKLQRMKHQEDYCLFYNTIIQNNHIASLKNLDDLIMIDSIYESLYNELDSNLDYSYYSFLLSEKTFEFSICVYEESNFLTQGQVFGDYNEVFRKETVITKEDSYLAILDNKFLNITNELEKHKNLIKEMQIIHDSFLFSGIKRRVFDSKYFKEFKVLEFYRGDSIFSENSEINYIYFLKEGSVNVSFNKSIIEIHDLTKYLINLDDRLFEKFLNYPEFNYTDIKNYQNKLKKKKNFTLFKFESKDILGAEEFYYKLNNRIYTATIVSESAKVYCLDIKNFTDLLSNEPKCKSFLEQIAFDRMNLIIERMVGIRNDILTYFHSETQYEEKRHFSQFLNNKKINVKPSVSVLKHNIKQFDKVLKTPTKLQHPFDQHLSNEEIITIKKINKIHLENPKFISFGGKFETIKINYKLKRDVPKFNKDISDISEIGDRNYNSKILCNFEYENKRIKLLKQSLNDLKMTLLPSPNQTLEFDVPATPKKPTRINRLESSSEKGFLLNSSNLKPKFMLPYLNNLGRKMKELKRSKEKHNKNDMKKKFITMQIY
jgi:CRP-like cAMP-binding protein